MYTLVPCIKDDYNTIDLVITHNKLQEIFNEFPEIFNIHDLEGLSLLDASALLIKIITDSEILNDHIVEQYKIPTEVIDFLNQLLNKLITIYATCSWNNIRIRVSDYKFYWQELD